MNKNEKDMNYNNALSPTSTIQTSKLKSKISIQPKEREEQGSEQANRSKMLSTQT